MPPKKKVLTPQVIRKIDYWLGIPLCAVLSGFRRVWGLIPFRRRPGPARKILFIKMTEQGATVLAWPAIRQAIEMVGKENVYFWVFRENRPVLELLSMIPESNIIDMRAEHPVEFLKDVARSLQRIRRLGIDTTVDLEFFSRASAIFAYITGASRRSGLHRFTSEGPYRGDLLTHRVTYNPYLHASETFRTIVRALACDPHDLPMVKESARGIEYREGQVVARPPDDALLRFEPSTREQDEICQMIQAETIGDVQHPVIILNPNASDMLPLRKWPTERFEDLARRILADMPQATIVFTGSPAEADVPEQIVRDLGSPRVISLAGKTSMRQLLCLYHVADALVTNDSGPGHFASMTDIHAVVLFGPETPLLFGPRGKNADVLWAGLACSPCVNIYNHRFSPCNNNVCMQAITVDQVMERLERHRN
jgi:ADP-heptose:LPS heptosyltransferase